MKTSTRYTPGKWTSVDDPDFQDTQTVLVDAFDLIAGDDPDSFDADFLPRIQEDALRVRP